MLDLLEGETLHVQGSASRPYQLKNVAGVLSCSCPAWRNQSLPIDRRTCKHLRQLRGDAAEEARLGTVLAARPKQPARAVMAPPLLLAESWDSSVNPEGWWLSEKLDGVRAYWDGKQLLSRSGQRYMALDWFSAGLPLEPLDGELWLGRHRFQRTLSIVRRHEPSNLWSEMRFVMFDAPGEEGGFETRLGLLRLIIEINRPAYAIVHPHLRCQGTEHLHEELTRIEALGGEGLMLRQAGSSYVSGRSSTLLKVKRFKDAEARVVGHEPGQGRHKGRLGALLVQLANGTRFAVGTGLADAHRDRPPPVGSVIRFRYQELTDAGVPRFPSYLGIGPDESFNTIPTDKGETPMAAATATRRFEFVEGSSNKFWEIVVLGPQVTVQFGRIGTAGQRETKTFPDSAAASRHADMKIREKLTKGYAEVG